MPIDLPAWVLGCYGNKEFRTPSLDRLAQVGTRFLNHVACAPAPGVGRATLVTGRTPMQLGEAGTAGPGEVTLDKLLGGAGYACQATDSSAEAVKLLGQQTAGKPFLLTVALTGLRPPYDGVPQKYREMYAQTKFETVGYQSAAANAQRGREMLAGVVASLRQYAAAVTALDEGVGAVLAAIGQRHLLDSTLVIFTSTCGALAGRHGLWDAADASDPPNMYQETTVTPMIWSWSGRVPTQLTRPELVSSTTCCPPSAKPPPFHRPSATCAAGATWRWPPASRCPRSSPGARWSAATMGTPIWRATAATKLW